MDEIEKSADARTKFRFSLDYLKRNYLLASFVSLHALFAILLGRLFALAPDESGYLYTFKNLYGISKDPNPQYQSGWITAPKPFLWITHLPSRLLNLAGVPDYLSLRLLSVALVGLSLFLLIDLKRRYSTQEQKWELLIFVFFLVPSVFLWTSVGLRESFILAEFSLILSGLARVIENRSPIGIFQLIVGSYGLMSTKNYIWICLIGTLLVISIYFYTARMSKKQLIPIFAALILVPSVLFASTTSVYALKFFVLSAFHKDLSGISDRSGDSILEVAIPNRELGTYGIGDPSGKGGLSGSILGPQGSLVKSEKTTIITFHGDTTLILMHFYFIDNPNSLLTKVFRNTGILKKIDSIWVNKVKAGLVKESKAALPDTSSLSGYILKPAEFGNPLSLFRPAFLFLFGPIPFLDQGGLALNIVSLESPLWWLLYLTVVISLVRFGRRRIAKDPVLLFSGVFFLALVIFSALVEVNLGTSFRHRSILLVPLLVLYIRTRSKHRVLAD